jgi:hypothetical protein
MARARAGMCMTGVTQQQHQNDKFRTIHGIDRGESSTVHVSSNETEVRSSSSDTTRVSFEVCTNMETWCGQVQDTTKPPPIETMPQALNKTAEHPKPEIAGNAKNANFKMDQM